VARDRQRAKQRKARRAGQNPGPAPSEPHRTNVPGELEHASGEVDEFDAALVAGAGGRPADADADVDPDADADRGADVDPDADVDRDADADDDLTPAARREDDGAAVLDSEADVEYDVEYDDEPLEDEEDDGAVAAGAPARRRGHGADAATTERGAAPARGPGRFMGFLRASWAELQRVQWPDRRQVFQATAVVLGFVVVAGLYLGVADRVAQELVDIII
jgi:preprotein translocase SecE subunit